MVHKIQSSTIGWTTAPFAGVERRTGGESSLPTLKRSVTVTTDHRFADRKRTVDEPSPPIASINTASLISDLATVGLCCLGTVAIGRQLWLRQRKNNRTRDGLEPWVPDDRVFQSAAVAIDALLADSGPLVPSIRLVRVGPEGFEFFLGSRVDWAPIGLTLESNGTSWMMRKEVATTSYRRVRKWSLGLPNRRSSRRRPIELWGLYWRDSVAVLGPRADELVVTLCSADLSQQWSEPVRARSDAGRVLLTWAGASSDTHGAQITTRQTDKADLTIVIDEHAATIHPQGVTLSPFRQRSQEPAQSRVLGEPIPAGPVVRYSPRTTVQWSRGSEASILNALDRRPP